MIIEQNNSEIITGRRVHTYILGFFSFSVFSFSHYPFLIIFFFFTVQPVRSEDRKHLLLSSMVSSGLLLIGFSLFFSPFHFRAWVSLPPISLLLCDFYIIAWELEFRIGKFMGTLVFFPFPLFFSMFSILFPFCQSGSRAPYNYCFSRFLLNIIFSFSSRLSRMGERGKEKAKKFDSRLSFLLSSVPQLFPYFLMPFSPLRTF